MEMVRNQRVTEMLCAVDNLYFVRVYLASADVGCKMESE